MKKSDQHIMLNIFNGYGGGLRVVQSFSNRVYTPSLKVQKKILKLLIKDKKVEIEDRKNYINKLK